MDEPQNCDYDRLAADYDHSRNVTEFYARHWTSKLIESGGISADQAVLDIGCGTGRYTECLKSTIELRVVGIDLSREMLKSAREKIPGRADGFIQARCEHLPFVPESFDSAFMFFVLHHVPQKYRASAYSEVLNVLKPGGKFIVVTRSHEQIKNSLVGLFPGVVEIDSTRMPDIDLLENDLRSSGFSGVRSRNIAHFTQKRSRTDFINKVENKFISTLSMFDDIEFKKRFETFKSRLDEKFGSSEELYDPLEFAFVIAEK